MFVWMSVLSPAIGDDHDRVVVAASMPACATVSAAWSSQASIARICLSQ
jgi:hypothetical protein